MITNSLSDIKDSLAGNLGKICCTEIKNYRLTDRLSEVRGDEIWLTCHNDSDRLFSRKASRALYPIGGQ